MTLLEVLLAVTMLVFLIGVTAIGLRSLTGRGAVGNAVKSFAVGLRMSRTEAASLGKRLRLSFDEETMDGRVLALPTRQEIDAPVEEQLIVEFYSR